MSTRIVLVDDHGIVRQGLRSLIEGEPDLEVVGEAEDGRKAMELAKEKLPDMMIMDITMPNLNGVDATRQITREIPSVKVLGLSIHSDVAFVADILKAGAKAYVLKENSFEDLVEAIRTVSAGEMYLSPGVAGAVLGDYLKRLSGTAKSPRENLTEREREVLQLIAEGKNTKQIGLVLHLSLKAIEAIRRKLKDKLEAPTVADLVKIAIRGGLTSLEG